MVRNRTPDRRARPLTPRGAGASDGVALREALDGLNGRIGVSENELPVLDRGIALLQCLPHPHLTIGIHHAVITAEPFVATL